MMVSAEIKHSIILGISAYYHDSAATLLVDGVIVAAAQEERFSRKKHDAAFPEKAISCCLASANVTLDQVDFIAFYDKPLLKFERIIETYLQHAPRGIRSFFAAMPIWLKDKLYLKQTLRRELAKLSGIKESKLPKLLFNEHHRSHAASAFYPSPYLRAAVLCLDGVGEWATSTAWLGEGSKLTQCWEINFPHSLGLLYSAFTFYAGFKVNSGEYKLMGLAPYGEPKYTQIIRDNLIDIRQDGTFQLNMKYFNFCVGFTMVNDHFCRLFGAPPRKPESQIGQHTMDIAASIQEVTQQIILKLTCTVHKETGMKHLCLAGGVALNCVANGLLSKKGPFEQIWIQPAAGDAGGSLGAALSTWYEYLGHERVESGMDAMQGAYLGPAYEQSDVEHFLSSVGARYQVLKDSELQMAVAELIQNGKVVGWFQGRMEFGPRALGNRSILGDPRSSDMQRSLNLKIKFRESFRPFAPVCKVERAQEWFTLSHPSPYMLFVCQIAEEKLIDSDANYEASGFEKLGVVQSRIPAVTHVDTSARLQTIDKLANPRLYGLLDCFEQITGCPILVNTSFNVRGEPIVESPEQAFNCFVNTDMDCLVMENAILLKQNQDCLQSTKKRRFELD